MRAERENPSTRAMAVGAIARTALTVALAATGVSCFDGADALGLPCRSDADCGQGQRCEQDFCGGPPATGGDASSSSSSSETSESSNSSGSETSGPLPSCGDGVIDSGEECDPGPSGDATDCDYDCTTVSCGDGYANLVAGEECDDANEEILDDCTPECRATLFWDDMEVPPGGKWQMPELPEHTYMMEVFQLTDGWRWETEAVSELGYWYSGNYSEDSGTARLRTRSIEVPSTIPPGFRYELRLRHRLDFDFSACEMNANDGGVIRIRDIDTNENWHAGPLMGQAPLLQATGFCEATFMEPGNPLYDPKDPPPVYAGSSGGFVPTGFPLPPEIAGRTVEIVFEIGYDCVNCWMTVSDDAGWSIDWVVVAPFPV